ncbi:MAG: hypothetical protein Q9164_006094 [Protoblastenia rupestris]
MAPRSSRRPQDLDSSVAPDRESKPTVKVHRIRREEGEHRRHRKREGSRKDGRDEKEDVYIYRSSKDGRRQSEQSRPPVVRRATVTGTSFGGEEDRPRAKPHRRGSERISSGMTQHIPRDRHEKQESESKSARTRGERPREKDERREFLKRSTASKHHEEAKLRSEKRTKSGDLLRSSRDRPTVVRSTTVREQPPTISHRPPLLRSKTTTTPRQAQATSHVLPRTSKAPVEPAPPRVTRAHSVRRSERPASIIGSLFGNSKPTAPPKPEKQVECLTCLSDEPISKTTHLPCGHNMCHACMRRLFTLSLTDPAHMPPRCCDPTKPIDLTKIDHLFDRSFKHKWNKKYAEFTTKNRLYCPTRHCGSWIKPRYIFLDRSSGPNGGKKYGVCGTCKTKVCVTCNNKYHTSRECPKDPATQEFLRTAKEQGWQRCYNCKATVELAHGCNHMTCRCGAEFCMACGTKWKGCTCVLFDDTMIARDREDHLHNRPAPWFRDEGGRNMPGAWDPVVEDPHIHQQRRREQERRDEAIARHLQTLNLADNDHDFFGNNDDGGFGVGNAAPHFLNTDFVHRAHEILTTHLEPAIHELTRERHNERVNGHWNQHPPRAAARPPHRPPPPPVVRRQTTASHDYDNGDGGSGYVHTRPTPERAPPRRASVMDYLEEFMGPAHAPVRGGGGARAGAGRPPAGERRASTLAGINRGQSGEGRVDEWRRHVEGVV